MRRIEILLGTLMLTACGDDRPPAPTAEEAKQLNAMEDLLNQHAAEEKGPEERAPSGPKPR